jgi:hypothetical protein
MGLEDPRGELERALADLRRVRESTGAWSDEVRRRFDEQRLTPLREAGTRLLATMSRVQEQFAQAERIIDRQD